MSQATTNLEIRPISAAQEAYLSTHADIALFGGAAGGGKSFTLLLEPLRHVGMKDFGAVIFRRTYPEIRNEGGLWDESQKIYPLLGARPIVGDLRYDFPSGAAISFGHMQHDATVHNWQGSQIPFMGWDELTRFTEFQFIYMLSRNRSTCGIRPYMRATCNPDAASWVARWVEWFIDPDTGYPIQERSGKLRWFIRDGETLRWGNSREELIQAYLGKEPKSFTFIPSRVEDNTILMKADPGYKANLEAQSRVELERLLKGNWLISDAKGEWPSEYFGRHLWFTEWPKRTICTIAWDPSIGEDAKYGDYSSFTILQRDNEGILFADAIAGRWPVEEGIDIGLELCREFLPDGFAIETNLFQRLIAANLIKRSKELGIMPPVHPVENRVRKDVRIRRLGPHFANKTIRLKAESTGARLISEQAMTFPNGEYDDCLDSTEMALRLMIDLWNGQQGQQQRGPRRVGVR